MTFDNNAELSFSSEDGPTGRERIHKKNRISKSFIVFGKIIFCCFPRIISTIYTSATVFLSMVFPFSPSFFHCFPQIPSLSAQLWHRNKPAENICKAVKSPSITVIRSPAIGSKVILQLLFCVSLTVCKANKYFRKMWDKVKMCKSLCSVCRCCLAEKFHCSALSIFRYCNNSPVTVLFCHKH